MRFLLFIGIISTVLTAGGFDISSDAMPEDRGKVEKIGLSQTDGQKKQAFSDYSFALFDAMNNRKKLNDMCERFLVALENDPESAELTVFCTALRGKDPKAPVVEKFRMIAENNPDAMILNRSAAILLGEKKRIDDANRILRKSIRRNLEKFEDVEPRPDEAKELALLIAVLSKNLLQEKKTEEVLELLEKAEDFEKLNRDPVFIQTCMAFYFERSKNASDRKPFLWGTLGTSEKQAMTEKFNESFNRFSQLLSDPKRHTGKQAFAASFGLLRELGKKELIFSILAEPLLTNPGDRGAMRRLAAFYMENTEFRNAARAIRLAENPEKKEIGTYLLLANALFRAGDYAEAAKAYEVCILLGARTQAMFQQAAWAYFQAELYDQALVKLKRLDAKNPDRLYLEALCRREKSEWKQASDAMKRYAETVHRNKFKVVNERQIALLSALLAEKAKDYDFLEKTVDAELKRNPANTEMLNFLGYTLADANRKLPKAEKLLREAVRQDPENPAILDSMAWVLFRLKQYREAERFMEKSFAFSRKNGESPDAVILDHAAEIAWALGKKEKAISYWKQAENLYSAEISRSVIQEKLKKALQITCPKLP